MITINSLIKLTALILLAISVAYNISYRNLKQDLKATTSILEEKQAEIVATRLENGRLKQEKQTAVLDAGNAKRAMEYYQEEAKDLKENHNVKISNLHSYYRARLETIGSGQTEVKDTTIVETNEKGDSIITKYPKININDGYLTLAGYFTKDKFNYQYSVSDSLSIAYHWTQKGIWPFRSNDKLMVSFSSQNPNTKLVSATSITIEDKKKTRFSVGPYIGYGITTDGKASIQVGFGIQYSLVRF